MRRAKVAGAAAAVAGAALLTFTWSLFSRPVDTSSSVFVVRQSDFELRVDATGTLDAARSETLTSQLRGDQGKVLYLAEDGARVAPGDVLVRFDATLLETELARQASELRSREAVRTYVKQALEVEKSQVEKALAQAETAARSAREESARYQAYLDDLEGLARRGVPVASEIAQARRKAERAQVKLEEAGGDFERAKREAIHRLAQAMAEVNKAENEVRATSTSLALTRAELDRTVLSASAPGFVVLHEVATGDHKRRLRVGDTVWQGQPILHLPDLSAMTVRSRVREADLHKVREGQEAVIRVEAYSDSVFRGRVVGIGALALEAGPSGSAGKHFQMSVALEGPDDRLRPGMSARVAIVADRAQAVVAVPIAAIFHDGEQAICYVAGNAGVRPRVVSLGRRGDDLVEVVAGLSLGERVSLVRP